MSKKLAAGSRGIVLDVKLGHGAFMKTLEEARALATTMVQIGVDAGRDMVALLSDVNQPLGAAVGNALEVAEAVRTLQGEGPADFHAHCVEVAAHMLRLAGQGERWEDLGATRAAVDQALRTGAGFNHLHRMVQAQGGDVAQIEDLQRLPQAKIRYSLRARKSGTIGAVFADRIAWATLSLGAGRRTKGDEIDHAVGIEVQVKIGDAVAAGDLLMTVHANDETSLQAALEELGDAVAYSESPVDPLPLFHGVVDGKEL